MTVTPAAHYSAASYLAGDEVAKGDRLTFTEAEIVSHPDNTSGIGANRIAMGDPVGVKGIVGVSLTQTAATTDPVVIQTTGVFTLNVNCTTTNATPGAPIYLGATDGSLTTVQAAGKWLFGFALGTTSANENPAKIAVKLVGAPVKVEA